MHLIKLCVGVDKWQEIPEYQSMMLQGEGKIYHQTRNFPKKYAEIIANGSLYWVIRGQVLLRQKILGFDTHYIGETRYCQILLQADYQLVIPTPWRAFQGWRYLPPDQSPPDLHNPDDILHNQLKQMGVF